MDVMLGSEVSIFDLMQTFYHSIHTQNEYFSDNATDIKYKCFNVNLNPAYINENQTFQIDRKFQTCLAWTEYDYA